MFRARRFSSALCAALLALTAVTLAVWIGRAVVREVDALTEDAETLGRGQLPAPRTCRGARSPSGRMKSPSSIGSAWPTRSWS